MSSEISSRIMDGLRKRHRKEKFFKNAGIASIILSLVFLVILFVAIIEKGYGAFTSYKIALEIEFPQKNADEISYNEIIKNSLKNKFPEAKSIIEKSDLFDLITKDAAIEFEQQIIKNPAIKTEKQKQLLWFSASSKSEMYLKGKVSEQTEQEARNINDNQIAWLKTLKSENKIKSEFNWPFFKSADSREPELAGMAASISGSFFTMIIFLLCAFPIGVMSAFYLEIFAPKNIFTDIIEISINNLAAIPSIIFGLLGLIVYLNYFHLVRSSSVVGGLTLSLLVLPIIIIATRNAINAIPSSVRDGAVAMGASEVQVMFHFTLPLALPGIMTGTILAMSRALGETAPLLMIGMVAFIGDIPKNFTDPATVMPVQIYLWSDSSEPGFAEKTAAAIMVLLGFLIAFNSIAVYLRKKFEIKW